MNSAVKSKDRAGIDFGRALKDGVIIGIIAFALLGPLVGLKTDQRAEQGEGDDGDDDAVLQGLPEVGTSLGKSLGL